MKLHDHSPHPSNERAQKRIGRPLTGLCVCLLHLGFVTFASAQLSITFEEVEFSEVSSIDGLVLETLNGVPIPRLTFGFEIGGESSPAAMIRGGPGDSPFVQEPGIEGPTGGELRLDFDNKVSQVIFGISLSRRQAQQDAIRVRTYDALERVIAESYFSTSAIEGSFSGTWISVASSDGFMSLTLDFASLANRFSMDNLFIAAPAGTPQTVRISDRASDSNLLHGPDDRVTLTWTEHLDDDARSLQSIDLNGSVAPRVLLGSRPRPSLLTPSTTRSPEGRLLVGWSGASQSPTPSEPSQGPAISGRFLSAAPDPRDPPGDEFTVAHANPSALAIAQAGPGANWFLWSEDEILGARRVDDAGVPSSPIFQLGRSSSVVARELLGTNEDTAMFAVWEEQQLSSAESTSGVFAALVGEQGFDEETIVRLSDTDTARDVDVARRPDGGFVAVWLSDHDDEGSLVRARHLDQNLKPEGPSTRISPARARQTEAPRIAINQAGDLAVVWTQLVPELPFAESSSQAARELAGRFSSDALLDGAWTELQIPTLMLESSSPVAPKIQLDEAGTLAIAWEAEDGSLPTTLMATTLSLARPACGSTVILCLAEDRFEVEVSWSDFEGTSGDGTAIPLSDGTGLFWFFTQDSAELVVKVLDGRAINNSFWIYYGSLTNVEFELTITDKATGVSKTYWNPAGEFASVGDTSAFPEAPGARSRALEPPPSDWLALPLPSASITTPNPGPCDADSLCLGPEGRFEIVTTWSDFDGATGIGRGQSWSESSGYAWFFDPSNVELFVKVLDGRAINGWHWVYFASLSNVAFELTVIDRVTGATASYSNPSGTFASSGDIRALPGN